MSGTTKIRPTVVVAEDNHLMLTRLQLLLAPYCELVAAAEDGNELVSAARLHRPQVIVSDIDMPGMTGLEAARIILAEQPGTRIVFVTALHDAEIIRAALSLGALGYVGKRDVGQELLPAIDSSLDGQIYVSSSGWNAFGRRLDQRLSWSDGEQ